METRHFGNLLREARERRSLSLAHVAEKIKISSWSVQMLEEAKLDDLPPPVFVRGFIRSYARSVGVDDAEPLNLFEETIAQKRKQEEALLATPVALPELTDDTEDDGTTPRRGIGLAVFVIIVLLIATITLSMFMRQPPQSGERLSMGGPVDHSGTAAPIDLG